MTVGVVPPRRPPVGRLVRTVGRGLSLVLTWSVAGVAALLVLLVALGWRPVVLVSGSMAPAAPAGSLVVAAPVAGEEVGPGDVVTVPWQGTAAPVTHRVVAVEQGAGGALFAVTQGDANAAPDLPVTRLDDRRVLRARAVLPGAGAVLTGRLARVTLGVGLVALGAGGLGRLWLPRGRVAHVRPLMSGKG